LANSQTAVYAHGEYDLSVDTTSEGPEKCAERIADALGLDWTSKAFNRLRGGRNDR